MLTIIYPYRNRDTERIKRSLDSLQQQTVQDFNVYFVDYGSDKEIAAAIASLVEKYDFAEYRYLSTQFQPWNKSKALNSVIKHLKEGYCFVADVDMIFHPQFVERAISLQKEETATYFKVGFLSETESQKELAFEDYTIDFPSTDEATGLTMFSVPTLHAIRGFDEFYHFWGSEDTDVHVRLKNNGVKVEFYDKEILMLHQWHPGYRNKEKAQLTTELQLEGIVRLNYQHLKGVKKNKTTDVNPDGWGDVMTSSHFEELFNYTGDVITLTNKIEEIDHFLFVILKNLPLGISSFEIVEDTTKDTLKYKIKKTVGKKVSAYYSLKEVNDKLLLHIISFYRNYPYIYSVSEAQNSIKFTLIKPTLDAT